MTHNLKTLLFSRGKRILLSLALVLAITFQGQIKDIIVPEKPVSKTLEISMYAKAAYSGEIYKGSKAKVHVTISKYRNKKFQVIYDTILEAGDLNNLPSQKNAFTKAIQVNNFYEGKELLVATYTVSYESNGSVLKYDKHILIPESKGKRELAVTI
ncbi:MAG TPA: hypothetical protein VF622_17155 [Segetibacter sp.]|jgi:hypothetical protein